MHTNYYPAVIIWSDNTDPYHRMLDTNKLRHCARFRNSNKEKHKLIKTQDIKELDSKNLQFHPRQTIHKENLMESDVTVSEEEIS